MSKKPKHVLVRHRVKPTLIRIERNIPHNASLEALRAHRREAGLVAFVMEELLQMLGANHSIIVVKRPEVSEENDIAQAERRTTIRAAFILAEGQAPGIAIASVPVALNQAFEYDTLAEVSDDPITAIITPEGRK